MGGGTLISNTKIEIKTRRIIGIFLKKTFLNNIRINYKKWQSKTHINLMVEFQDTQKNNLKRTKGTINKYLLIMGEF